MMRKPPLYFDAISALRPSVKTVSEIAAGYEKYFANPYAPHKFGQEAFSSYAKSLEKIYSLCGFDPKGTVVLTSSGAEAINQVFASAFQEVCIKTGCDQLIVSSVNEAPSLMCANYYKNLDLKQTLVTGSREGTVSVEALKDAFSARTALVSVSWVNALTGVVNPIEEIAALCEERGVFLHVDATHALGKLYTPFQELPIHYVTVSSEPLGGPVGTGLLYASPNTPLAPLIQGGEEQGGYRASYPAVPLLEGLVIALEELFSKQGLMVTEISRLRSFFEESLKNSGQKIEVFFEDQLRAPHCSSIGVLGVSNEALCYHLCEKGIFPCLGGGNLAQISYHLEACGIPPKLANTALSFSFPCSVTEEEISFAAEEIIKSVCFLRKTLIEEEA